MRASRAALLLSAGFIPATVIGQGSSPDISTVLEEALRAVMTVEVTKMLNEGVETARIFASAGSSSIHDSAWLSPVYPEKPSGPYSRSIFVSHAKVSGSGFLVREGKELFLVTNAHVATLAANDSLFAISQKGRRYLLDVAGVDMIRDIAVCRFLYDQPGSDVTSLVYNKSAPRVGERVYMLGTPVGIFPSSVAEGIVSGINRQLLIGANTSSGYIQHTAAIVGGNSGGPLIDASGRLVGMNTKGEPGVAFALSATLISDTVAQIARDGHIMRADLGIEFAQLGTVDREQIFAGDYTNLAFQDATATRTGSGAFSLEGLNGVPVETLHELSARLDELKPGDALTLDYPDPEHSDRTLHKRVVAKRLTLSEIERRVREYVERTYRLRIASKDGGLVVQWTGDEPGRLGQVTMKAGPSAIPWTSQRLGPDGAAAPFLELQVTYVRFNDPYQRSNLEPDGKETIWRVRDTQELAYAIWLLLPIGEFVMGGDAPVKLISGDASVELSFDWRNPEGLQKRVLLH